MDSKYSQIITKLGFKHQLCIFHAKKSLNKQLKVFKDKFHLSKEEFEECHQQLKMIKDLFDLDDYDEAEKELQSLIFRKNEFHGSVKNLTDEFSVFSQNISFCPI